MHWNVADFIVSSDNAEGCYTERLRFFTLAALSFFFATFARRFTSVSLNIVPRHFAVPQ